MSARPIISVEHLTKAYRIWQKPSARLISPIVESFARLTPGGSGLHRILQTKAAAGYRDFYALSDISFHVSKGEAIGVIGRNGSGKSTLLQLIAGTLQPTSGRCEVHGRIAALLELGSGFNPEFTGVENVYLNGSILGFSRSEMERKFAEIAAFADIGDFIRQPVKLYSSGMTARLAFAVQQALEPDILIVDEALSVGDVFFQQKCFQRIREILARGTTLFYVSHDLAGVQNLCDRAILLHAGRMVHLGDPEECVSRYYALSAPASTTPVTTSAGGGGLHPAVTQEQRSIVRQHDIVGQARSRHGDRRLEIAGAAVINERGDHVFSVEMMNSLRLQVLLKANEPVSHPAVGLQLHDRMANLVFAAGTPQKHFHLPAMARDEEILLEFTLTCSLQPGEYTVSLDAGSSAPHDPNGGSFHDRVGGLGPLTVHYERSEVFPFYGMAHLPLEIRYV